MGKTGLTSLFRREFKGYNGRTFAQDALAGLTVTAVALPLALAFGVASGATASAGLITAIVAGLVIGLLSGAPYQISGPTGAMSAILILLVQKYGLPGVWVAGLISGAILLVLGLLKLGKLISYIPSPVITGFTSGIALIIAIGQIDNFLGITTPGSESAALKLFGYFKGGFMPDWHAAVFGAAVIAIMVLWPKKWQARFPSSLAAIVVVLAANALLNWTVPMVGDIPRTLLPQERLVFSSIPWADLGDLVAPAITIAVLGMVESLLCGAVAGNMTGKPLKADQELIAQGVGNMLVPFLGGVPATAAIARTSVGIKSGGQTRMVSVIHSVGLLASMFLLAPVMSRIPLSALAGVLMVTAFRMNEWESIRFMLHKRFKAAILAFAVTMVCTVALDLTQAILVGVGVSAVLFLKSISDLEVQVLDVDPERLREKGIQNAGLCRHAKVAYLTGPVFFAAVDTMNTALQHLEGTHTLILSMRGVPLLDICGLQAMVKLTERMQGSGCTLMLASVQPQVMKMMERGGLLGMIQQENIFWSADQAIVEAERRGCLCSPIAEGA